MRKHSLAWLIGALFGVLVMVAPPEAARAQNSTGLVVATCGTPPSPFTAGRPGPYTVDVNGNNCITGSFSATLAGFTPNGNFGTLTATAASSGSTALPVGAVVAFQNKSSIDLSCVLSAGAATATTDKLIVRAGATVFFTVGANVNTACINQAGVASNVVVMAGGAGLGTNFGGASAGGGGGGAVFGPTANGAAAANPPVLMGGTIDGSATGAVGNWKVLANGTGFFDAVAGGNLIGAINSAVPGCAGSPCVTTIGNTGEMANVGGVDTKAIKCGSSAVYDASTNGSTQLVALSGATSVYVCGYTIMAGGTVNVKLITGTGAACVTGTASITPAYQLTAQAGVADGANEYRGLKGAVSSELCINTSAGVAVQAIVYYTQF